MGHSRAEKENNPNMTPPLQTLVMVIILIIAIVKQTTTIELDIRVP